MTGGKSGGKGKKSPAVPARGTEVTVVGNFPRPAAWGKRGSSFGDAAEVPLMQAKTWHPTTDDFLTVANVPNTGQKKPLTKVFVINNVGEMLGAILDLDANGKARRPLHSIQRFNIISHGIAQIGKFALYGMAGTIKDDGACLVKLSIPENPNDPNAPMGGGLDESVLDWLDTTAQSLRDDCRNRFRKDGEIGLILCNSAGVPLGLASQLLMPRLAKTFDVRVRGYDDEIVYDNLFDTHTKRIKVRDLTKIGQGTGNREGPGYFCEVKVAKALAGLHLEFNKNVDKPAKPSP